MGLELTDLLEQHRWDEAIAYVATAATADNSILDYIHQLRWRTEGPSLQAVQHSLASIKDSLWVVETCLLTIVEEYETDEAMAALGLERVQLLSEEEDMELVVGGTVTKAEAVRQLRERQALLATYRAWTGYSPPRETRDEELELEQVEPEDPWDDAATSTSVPSSPIVVDSSALPDTPTTPTEPPLPLVDFLRRDLHQTAMQLAAEAQFPALRILITRHTLQLRPHRFDILAAIPSHISPVEFLDLLPCADASSGREIIGQQSAWASAPGDADAAGSLLETEKLTEWYATRVKHIDAQSGMVQVQLAYIQHGAAQGVKGLDTIGEDLSLLSKIVYDAGDNDGKWSLASWQAASSQDIVRGYLASSSPTTIVTDIRRLVLPYLYVLESRAERAGRPSNHVVEKHINEIILSSPLSFQLPLFEASKATLPSAERLIKQDLDVARLALACLYGSSEQDQWNTMSRIFECLPVWDIDNSNSDDQEAAATTLESLGAYVRPSAYQTTPPAAADMYLFFSPLPFASLSRALDILDVHLESGEILAKWGITYPLRFFVQSAGDVIEQRSCAVKISRDAGRRISTVADWERLLEDMLKLRGGGDGLLRGALGMLSRQEVLTLFLEGLLASTCPYNEAVRADVADFDIAARLVKRTPLAELSSAVTEEIVLRISQEFYDNAEQGSLHTGNMKHAYFCLEVVPMSNAVRQQKEFIEATSRILTYNIQSSEQGSVSPLQIRLARNRLDIIAKVLASSQGAYRHETVILEIVDKLGYRGNKAAHVAVMCKLIDLAVDANDSEHAYGLCEKLLRSAVESRGRREQNGHRDGFHSDYQTCWETLARVARMPKIASEDRGAHLLAAAVRLCPAGCLGDLLPEWRVAEASSKSTLPNWLPTHTSTPASTRVRSKSSEEPVVTSTVLGSRRAARAAQMAVSFSEHLAERLPASQLVQDGGPQVSRNAKLALAKGVGWLLGEGDGQRH